MEKGLTRNQVINELTKSSHGKLEAYADVVRTTAKDDPEFLAHLTAWNRTKGQIRDSKVALPILSIASPEFPEEFVDNSLAHFALLDVKMKEQGLRFLKTLKLPARRDRAVKNVLRAYLEDLESNHGKWERVAVMHRRRLKSLYVAAHFKGKQHMHDILHHAEKGVPISASYVKGSVFDTIARLGDMSPAEAAGAILERRIPSLVAVGSLGANGGKLLKERDVMMALTKQMSATEVVTRSASLAKKGAKADPVLRTVFNEAMVKVSSSGKNVLKTTRAAEVLEEAGEVELAAMMRNVQEKQIAKMAGIDGNWLVLGDMSGSMASCIETARYVAATLAKFVKGQVHLVFFNVAPQYFDATGKTYEQILAMTKFVKANGGTSIGCGLKYAIDKGLDVDGVAVITDADENTAPRYSDVMSRFAKSAERDIPTYLYLIGGREKTNTFEVSMQASQLDVQTFNLGHGQIDYYSLPNIVQTMRVNRYSLIDEILDTPLIGVSTVFRKGAVA